MDQNMRVAFVMSQVICATAEIEGMKAENSIAEACGRTIPYGEKAFNDVPNKYGLGHNDVLGHLRG